MALSRWSNVIWVSVRAKFQQSWLFHLRMKEVTWVNKKCRDKWLPIGEIILKKDEPEF